MKKFLSAVLAMSLMLSLAACTGGTDNSSSTADASNSEGEAKYSIAMVTDVGGVNDQSFNQSAHLGHWLHDGRRYCRCCQQEPG